MFQLTVKKFFLPRRFTVLCVTVLASTIVMSATLVRAENLPQDKESCLKQGGRWGQQGLNPTPQCNPRASDAKKVCRDDDECEGDCLADLTEEQQSLIRKGGSLNLTGACTEYRFEFGCHPHVQHGVVNSVICVD